VNEGQFTKRHRPDWAKLEAYLARLDGKGPRLAGEEILAFIPLYRKVTGDLARSRMLKLRPELVDYLNGLVGKVHFRVYAARSYPIYKVLDFYREGFPRMVRRLWRYVAASCALLFFPAVAAWWAVAENPHMATAFAPPGYVEKIEASFGESFGKEDRPSTFGALATSFYIVNNVQVSFLVFALGVSLGLGSVYVLAQNGMVLGGVGALIHQHGLSYNFWSFVSSHGGIELGAIVLAGAAGLRIGLALVNPGMLPRKAALVMFGVITLLVIAAVIEAFISPSTLPNPFKLGLGTINLAALLSYLAFAGRRPSAAG
jgi:uncharacterized membrane protein SpoIIM required for sporulation